jgi:hypothetical protein
MILLDTDVLIDVALDRRPYSDLASELLDRIEHGAEAAYIAWYFVSNLYYLAAPALGGVSARLRRPVHSHQERQGLRTLSNPCGRPAGGADRVVLMVGDSVPSSNAVARCRRGQNGGRLKGLRFVDYRVEGGGVVEASTLANFGVCTMAETTRVALGESGAITGTRSPA